jgi:hypothetical protein
VSATGLIIPPGLKAPMVDYAIATAKCGLAVVALHHPIIEPD